jgi:hypothetical protein
MRYGSELSGGTRASLLHRLVPTAEMKRRISLAKARFLTAVTYPLSNRGEKTGGNPQLSKGVWKAQRATERPDPFGKTGPENGHKEMPRAIWLSL